MGGIRFKPGQEIPVELTTRIILQRKAENELRTAMKIKKISRKSRKNLRDIRETKLSDCFTSVSSKSNYLQNIFRFHLSKQRGQFQESG